MAQFSSFDGNQMGDTRNAAERVVDIARGERDGGKGMAELLGVGIG